MEEAHPRVDRQGHLLWPARRDTALEAARGSALSPVNRIKRPLLPGERAMTLGEKQKAASPLLRQTRVSNTPPRQAGLEAPMVLPWQAGHPQPAAAGPHPPWAWAPPPRGAPNKQRPALPVWHVSAAARAAEIGVHRGKQGMGNPAGGSGGAAGSTTTVTNKQSAPSRPSTPEAQMGGVAGQRTPVQSKSAKAFLHVESTVSCFLDSWLPILKREL